MLTDNGVTTVCIVLEKVAVVGLEVEMAAIHIFFISEAVAEN